MSDNRTTELKSLSKLKMAGKLRYWRGTIEIPESELHAICDEIQAEHDRAVAATVGGLRSTVEIAELLDEFESECFMLRVEASETRARDDVVRESYDRILDEFAGRIAATLGNDRDEIYNAGFDNCVKATLQQLDGLLIKTDSAVEIQAWVDEQWKEYES